MNARSTTSSRRTMLVGALLVIAVGATAAGVAAAGAGDSDDPTPTPIVTPVPGTPGPVVTPAPQPSDEPAEPGPTRVPIENVTGHDVTLDIVDETGRVIRARSGTAGEGASVDRDTLRVENIDDRTLRLTWVDYAIDNELALYIIDDGARFVLVQPEPSGGVDSMVTDRELILEFSAPIDASSIETFLQGGLDTPGQ